MCLIDVNYNHIVSNTELLFKSFYSIAIFLFAHFINSNAGEIFKPGSKLTCAFGIVKTGALLPIGCIDSRLHL